MNKNSGGSGSGIGFFGLLTILFVGLKLIGYIDWSWLWVLSPMWLSSVIGLIIIGVVVIYNKIKY